MCAPRLSVPKMKQSNFTIKKQLPCIFKAFTGNMSSNIAVTQYLSGGCLEFSTSPDLTLWVRNQAWTC